MSARVIITDFIHDDLAPERQILGDLAEVVALNAMLESDLIGQVESADAIMMYHNISLTSATISNFKQCKLIVRGGVGVDNIDCQFARERGIPVANVPDYGTEEVADSAIALTLSLTRGTHFCNNRLQRGLGPWSYTLVSPLYRLRGRVFGIVGLGRIGMAAAVRAKALGLDVAFYDPHKPDGFDKSLGIRRVETLEELLKQSYVVSVHTPLTPETQHIIAAQQMAMMPKGSYLVNTARGGCVDLLAVPEMIRSGQLAGAGIDVFPQEPPSEDHPLIKAWRDPSDPCHDRVIINPHSAFYTEEGLRDIRIKGAQSCRRALLGQPIRNVVN
jgi:C-terminal binding protein